jgi:Uma2 family endonuclease
MFLTPEEFDAAEFEEGWRYELINGVLVASPIPAASERGPNDLLAYYLIHYRETSPQVPSVFATLPEHTVQCGRNRRRADRVIWAGPLRTRDDEDVPTIIVEFTSKRLRDRRRDYETKRDEYLEIGVKEYWVIDRFQRTMAVFRVRGGRTIGKVIPENEEYATPILPGFRLPLPRLLECADEWAPRGKKHR